MVSEVELRIWPQALSRFIASLKAGPFLLILLIKRICFVKQSCLFIKMEHNFIGFFFFFNASVKIAISLICHQKQSWGVCVRVCEISPSHKYVHAKYHSVSRCSKLVFRPHPNCLGGDRSI